jgi:hypothetical protein
MGGRIVSFWLRDFAAAVGKGTALKNLAGPSDTDGDGCMLSVGREVKMEIPVYDSGKSQYQVWGTNNYDDHTQGAEHTHESSQFSQVPRSRCACSTKLQLRGIYNGANDAHRNR